MKYILPLLFVLSCNSIGVKQEKLTKMDYTNLHCKQKILPLKVDYRIDHDTIFVKLTAEKDIQNLHVKDVHGLDGLTASLQGDHEARDLKRGETSEVEINITQKEGLTYAHMDVAGTVNGLSKIQGIVIPVGTLSEAQKNERSKDIRTQKDDLGTSSKGSKSSTEPEDIKVHVLKIE